MATLALKANLVTSTEREVRPQSEVLRFTPEQEEQLKEERTQLASHTNLTLSITSVAACDEADGEAGNATRIEWRRSSACRSRSRRPRGFSIAA